MLDRLLEPRSLLGLVACVLLAHVLLAVLLGGVLGLPSLYELFADPMAQTRARAAGTVLSDGGPTIAMPVLGVLAALFAALPVVCVRLTGLGTSGRVVLVLAVLPVALARLAEPLNMTSSLGIPTSSWTFVGFTVGLLVTTAIEGRLE